MTVPSTTSRGRLLCTHYGKLLARICSLCPCIGSFKSAQLYIYVTFVVNFSNTATICAGILRPSIKLFKQRHKKIYPLFQLSRLNNSFSEHVNLQYTLPHIITVLMMMLISVVMDPITEHRYY